MTETLDCWASRVPSFSPNATVIASAGTEGDTGPPILLLTAVDGPELERLPINDVEGDDNFNGVNGLATSADGTRLKVRGWAEFTVDNGVLIGDPAEFQGLSIRQVGP